MAAQSAASRSDFRELLGYGIHVVAGDALNFLSRNMDNLLIGVFLGDGPLGFYAVGYRVLDTSQQLLVNAARKLAFPVFARLQHDPDRTRRAYSRVTRAVSVIIVPGYIGLALVAQEAIVVVFGARWEISGPVAAVLFLIGPVLTVQLFSGALLNAVGHPEVTFRLRLITSIVNVAGFLVAVRCSATSSPWPIAFVLRGYLLMPLILVGCAATPAFRSRLTWRLRSTVLATLVMAAAVLGVKLVLLGHVHNAWLLAAEVLVGGAVFGVALFALERSLLVEVFTLIFQAVPGGAKLARRVHMPLGDGAPSGRRGGRRREVDESSEPLDGPVEEAIFDETPDV